MKFTIVAALFALAIGGTSLAAADDKKAADPKTEAKRDDAKVLNVGDPAPELKVSSWVKGEKIEKFEPGKTYVVEFWATWCGPCRASIPHITELAHKFKDKVRFIGVDVYEQDVSEVKPFLKEMGDKMDYNVALDDVKGGDPNSGHMAMNWLSAAGENGIPSAFVIQNQKIAWIGHPMEMDKPLEEIIEGKWDVQAAAKKRLDAKKDELKMMAVQRKIGEPLQNEKFDVALKAIDEALADDPSLAESLESVKFMCLCKLSKFDDAVAVGQTLAKKQGDSVEALNFIAWSLIDPENKGKVSEKVAKFSLETAKRGVEVSEEKEPGILDTYGRALFLTGDVAAAVKVQEKALKLLDEQGGKEQAPEVYKEIKLRLDSYRKAAAK